MVASVPELTKRSFSIDLVTGENALGEIGSVAVEAPSWPSCALLSGWL